MDQTRIKALEVLATLPTFSRSTTLQWIVPVKAAMPQSALYSGEDGASDHLEPPLDDHWCWTEVANDDLTDGNLDPSLSKLFGHRDIGEPEEIMPRTQRIRRYYLKSKSKLELSHNHYPMFDISGSGRTTDPQICDIRLVVTGLAPQTENPTNSQRASGPEGYLTILLRVPARFLPEFGAQHEASNGETGRAWTVTDVLWLNWALVGRAALRTVENESQKIYGRQSYKAWRVHAVDGFMDDDPDSGTPWLDFVKRILALPIDGFPSPFDLDLHQIPTSLASVVLPGATRAESILVAQHLGELLRDFDEANLVDDDADDPISTDSRLSERSYGIVQYVTQRCSGLVICAPPAHTDEGPPPAERPSQGPSSGNYRRWVLADELWKYWNYALFLVFHERRQLGRILDELSELEIPMRSGDRALHERQSDLETAMARLGAAEQAFYQLQAWFRYRVISRKYGLQNFYEHCYAEMRLEALYEDVEQILTGIGRVVQRQLESVGNELEEERNEIARQDAAREARFEKTVNVGGVVFAVMALIIGILSINIRQVTSNEEGLPALGVLGAVVALVAAGSISLWAFLRKQRADRHDLPVCNSRSTPSSTSSNSDEDINPESSNSSA